MTLFQIQYLRDGYWHKSDMNPFQYKLHNGSRVQLITKTELQSCVHEKFSDSITVIGDSHQRFLSWYLLRELDIRFPMKGAKKMKNMRKLQHSFIWSTYCPILRQNLDQYINGSLKSMKSNPQRSYLLHFGGSSWDIVHHNAAVSNAEFN